MANLPLRGPVAGRRRRVVLVTGAGSGIGQATAVRFARRGDTVLVTDIDEKAAKSTVATIIGSAGAAHAFAQDVTSVEGWETLSAQVTSEHGVPDVLVNNAGILITGSFLEQSVADWDRLMAVNLNGVFYGGRILGEAMAGRGTGGHIVNIASAGAWTPNGVAASYSVSKAAVLMLSESMRIDLSRSRIGVSAICPGVIRTNLAVHSTRAGVSEAQDSEFRQVFADAQARFSYAGPDAVARAVERAVKYNLGVVPVNPEAYFIQSARRVAPGLTRGVLGLGSMEIVDTAAGVLKNAVPSWVGINKNQSVR